MRELNLVSAVNPCGHTTELLSRNLTRGVLFPKLESLTCDIQAMPCTPLPFVHLLCPKYLKHVALFFHPDPIATPDQLVEVAGMISSLPSDSLQSLSVECGRSMEGPLRSAVSSLVCLCGSSLKELFVTVTLPEATILHLATKLSNLSIWRTSQGPPEAVRTSTVIRLPLEGLCLDKTEALPWLDLLASHENGPESETPSTNARNTLTSLVIDFPQPTAIDSNFLSPITKFWNLVTLCVGSICPMEGVCAFRLTDVDIEKLAIALPRLSSLELGHPCSSDTCNNTVGSLMFISLHCLELEQLEVHFNTKTIASDMKRLLDEDTQYRGKAKCKVTCLSVGMQLYGVPDEDKEIVWEGFNFIFPDLTRTNRLGLGYIIDRDGLPIINAEGFVWV